VSILVLEPGQPACLAVGLGKVAEHLGAEHAVGGPYAEMTQVPYLDRHLTIGRALHLDEVDTVKAGQHGMDVLVRQACPRVGEVEARPDGFCVLLDWPRVGVEVQEYITLRGASNKRHIHIGGVIVQVVTVGDESSEAETRNQHSGRRLECGNQVLG